ncbi:MAG TPA: heparan-alpha-glucosaminide N-acetyltransferase domain-containing protein [Acidobacteriaceae bacterium]|jgi:predicted acyltransferase|nr:heparan-alpha-glucosaminide N-acetyltransferase domain-containing protein [Acidobacteriaceae bacterium]
MSSATVERPASTPVSHRLISLDVLRGITIAFMILVNNNGDFQNAYWPLKHSVWNGWTPTDLVFPTFLFLMGVSVVFSTESRLGRGDSKRSLVLHIVRRFVILFLLGLLVNGFPRFNFATLRIYGVLQRIAICYLVAALLYLWGCRVRSQIALVIAALVGYWILMRWVPVPGYGLPVRDIPLLDPNANLVAYLDRHIFPGRLYEGVRDPEGLLSNLPAIGTTLLGMLTGMWLRSGRSKNRKALGMFLFGLLGLALGELWNPWFPINKKLWTSSYVLFAAGCALVLLALCYWAVEIKGWKRGWTYFWLVFGTNAITAYVFAELLSAGIGAIPVHAAGMRFDLGGYIYFKVFQPMHHLAFESLAYSICFVLVCFLPVLVLYRKKIFIRI